MIAPAHQTKLGLRFCNALRLKCAENWLALGHAEEAIYEWNLIPRYARKHPEVIRVKEQITAFPDEAVEAWLAISEFKTARKGA